MQSYSLNPQNHTYKKELENSLCSDEACLDCFLSTYHKHKPICEEGILIEKMPTEDWSIG